jgi:outer membrane receptor protein involved in Fe transport
VSVGGGADVDWHPVPRWGLGASGRVDANVDNADPLPSGSTSVPPTQGTDLRPTGHLGTEVLVGPVTLATHAGALARAPSFVERYGGGGVLANPTLASESALTADAGARYATKARHWRAVLEVDGFATHASDLITLVPEGALGLLKAENIASARIYGFEASVDLRAYGFDLRAAYTGLRTFDDDPADCTAGCTTRPPLVGRPANDFIGDLAYALGPVRVRYGLDVVAGLYADRDGQTLVPDRVLQSAGVRVAVPWVRTLRLAFDVNNLFDVRTGLSPGFAGPTREPIGDQFDYPLPGRSFLFTARWSPGAKEEPSTSRSL